MNLHRICSADTKVDKIGYFVVGTFIFTILVLIMTDGTGKLFAPELLSRGFDSLSQSMLSLKVDVDPSDMPSDGFDVEGKRYLYFGPVPALIRVPFNQMFPDRYGEWSRLMCLIATCMLLWGLLRILRQSSPCLASGPLLPLMVYFALGTPIVFLNSAASIHHEVILWSLCFSVWGISFLPQPHSAISFRSALGFSCCAALCLLTRITFALPLYGILIYLIARRVFLAEREGSFSQSRRLLETGVIMLPAIAGVVLQTLYNKARFGGYLTFIDLGKHLVPSLEKIDGVWSLNRIPDALLHYLLPRIGQLRLEWPFPFQVQPVSLLRPEVFIFWREETIGLLLSAPWIVLLSLFGFWRVLRLRIACSYVPLLCFLAQSVLICTFYFITERYSAEFLPLLIFLCSLSLSAALNSKRARCTIHILGVFSCVVSISSALSWNVFANPLMPENVRSLYFQFHQHRLVLPEWDGDFVYLSDIMPEEEKSSFRQSKRDVTIDDRPLSLWGKVYKKGLGAHAKYQALYQVPKGAVEFRAVVGLADEVLFSQLVSLRFTVVDENERLLFDSGRMTSFARPQLVQIPLGGIGRIALRIYDEGDSNLYDHGNWAEAAFLVRR